MTAWLGLIVAPLLLLVQQSLNYMLLGPSCRWQTTALLHAVSALTVAATLLLGVLAAHTWWKLRPAAEDKGKGEGEGDADADAGAARRHTLAAAAAGVACISMLAAAMLWVPVWLQSPCRS